MFQKFSPITKVTTISNSAVYFPNISSLISCKIKSKTCILVNSFIPYSNLVGLLAFLLLTN